MADKTGEFRYTTPMKKLYLLQNSIKNYEWGSQTMMSAALGFENPKGDHQAELWMGVHERGMSLAQDGKEWVPLDQLLRSDLANMLGPKAAKQFGNLPFLFKVLAAEKALSIQAHPNKAQAEAGFLAENKQGIPIDAPQRNYRDSNHKPEVTCAMSEEFWAMCGFRQVPEIVAEFQKLNLSVFNNIISAMQGEADEESQLKTFFLGVMGLRNGKMGHIIEDVVRYAEHQEGPAYDWIKKFYQMYGDDVGVLAPLYLNIFCLKKGQAVYLPAGQLHAYLQGMAVELMANSDNVLRGGLTPKHVDVPELAHVLSFHAVRPEILEAEGPDGAYHTPSSEFELHRVELGADYMMNGSNPAQIILCTQGRISIESLPGNPNPGQRLVLQRGEAVFMPYHAGGYIANGRGELFFAQIP